MTLSLGGSWPNLPRHVYATFNCVCRDVNGKTSDNVVSCRGLTDTFLRERFADRGWFTRSS